MVVGESPKVILAQVPLVAVHLHLEHTLQTHPLKGAPRCQQASV